MSEECVIAVAVEAPQHSAISAPLDYKCERLLSFGSLARVPLGRRIVTGIVWGSGASSVATDKLRTVDSVVDALPPLSRAWGALVEFAAAYYQRGLGEVALAVLPPELRRLDAAQVAQRVARWSKKTDAALSKLAESEVNMHAQTTAQAA